MADTQAQLQQLTQQANTALLQLLGQAKLQAGQIVVIGCSSSEVAGQKIGTASSPEIAAALLEGFLPLLHSRGLYLAAQCCEHLNRALIVEAALCREYRLEPVNVLPQPKAGGSFATAAWQAFTQPAAVEAIQAHAGLDIGSTLIGMHLRPVAVPVRLEITRLGNAALTAARTRPKFIGGQRAMYQTGLL